MTFFFCAFDVVDLETFFFPDDSFTIHPLSHVADYNTSFFYDDQLLFFFFAIINVVAENLDWVWGLLASLVKYMFH